MSERNITKIKETFEQMTKFVKPPGPPKIWEVVEKTTKDGRLIKFTIQEIPEDRYEDAIEHMCKYFLADEPTCACFNAVNTPIFVEETKMVWKKIVDQGIAIAALVDNPDGGKPIIAGINMVFVEFKDDDNKSIHFSSDFRITYKVMTKLNKELQLYKRYGIDKYLYALGLSVEPAFRGLGLGTDLLRARDKIGSEYNISMTSTVFTSPYSIKAAERTGFETLLKKDYSDLVDENGKEYFPNIQKLSKALTIMTKRLC